MSERATVKFFNADKNWGFLEPRDGRDDVFVHGSKLRAAGIRPEEMVEGREVEITTSDGKPGKGPQVETISLV